VSTSATWQYGAALAAAVALGELVGLGAAFGAMVVPPGGAVSVGATGGGVAVEVTAPRPVQAVRTSRAARRPVRARAVA